MLVHYARGRWIVRCDGVHGDRKPCTFAVEGVTPAAAASAAKAQGMRELAGGRWACCLEHKGGVS